MSYCVFRNISSPIICAVYSCTETFLCQDGKLEADWLWRTWSYFTAVVLYFASVFTLAKKKKPPWLVHFVYHLKCHTSGFVSSGPISRKGREWKGTQVQHEQPLLLWCDDGDKVSKENAGAGLFIHGRGHFWKKWGGKQEPNKGKRVRSRGTRKKEREHEGERERLGQREEGWWWWSIREESLLRAKHAGRGGGGAQAYRKWALHPVVKSDLLAHDQMLFHPNTIESLSWARAEGGTEGK